MKYNWKYIYISDKSKFYLTLPDDLLAVVLAGAPAEFLEDIQTAERQVVDAVLGEYHALPALAGMLIEQVMRRWVFPQEILKVEGPDLLDPSSTQMMWASQTRWAPHIIRDEDFVERIEELGYKLDTIVYRGEGGVVPSSNAESLTLQRSPAY